MFGVCAGLISSTLSAHAAANQNTRKKTQTRRAQNIRATVFVEGAAIYSQPNFDSPVKDYLAYDTKVIVAKKPVAGAGGLGLFHRVKYAGGKLGYITDTDIRIVRGGSSKESTQPAVEKGKDPLTAQSKAWEKEERAELGNTPLYFTRYLGGAVAMVNFSEKFSGQTLTSGTLMYGLRMTGPGTLWDGPPIDMNIWFSLTPPKYLSVIDDETSTGFFLFGDVQFMLPMLDTKTVLISYGPGIMWTYTNFKVPIKTRTFDSQEFRIGLDFGLGLGLKVTKKLMARTDIKYYYERTQYLGYIFSVQGEY